MPKFKQNEIVNHQSGSIRGVIQNVIEMDGFPTNYYVEWDDGTFRHCTEKELRHINSDTRPKVYGGFSE